MELLEFSHNPWLVAASIAVSLMAGFTGFSLTRGASEFEPARRKVVVVMAAIALGGGIWSMHFVAMLGLQMPVLYFYDALVTLISALIAILMVGLALLVLHFLPRTDLSLFAAGAIIGLGIVIMHFVGMLGMRLCRPVNSPADYAVSATVAILLSALAIRVAYTARDNRNILLGTVCFGVAVATVHFFAIAQTGFVKADATSAVGSTLSNQTLALGVTVAAFLICGGFLLTAVTFFEKTRSSEQGQPDDMAPPTAGQVNAPVAAGIPFERDGRTHFADRAQVAAVRAEGHYTLLYVGDEKLFCPWSITEADQRLTPSGFVRVHRSYLVNPAHVSSFERLKDNGVLYFESVLAVTKVPVSRSRLATVREALGL
ncbi:MAG: MHYT domain-containing protein [Rhodobacter sp.]|nr:MHYT domain-containing protein [Rhodobacter sp.]